MQRDITPVHDQRTNLIMMALIGSLMTVFLNYFTVSMGTFL